MEVLMRSSLLSVGLILGGVPALAGCGEVPVNPDRCNIRLAVVSPDPATLTVGQEVTLVAQLTASADCLPGDAKTGNLRWSTQNSSVATIDPVSGRLKALGPGATEVSLMTATTQRLLTTSVVQVGP
jgi:Bacterial Ig-like domain (group 2)